MARNFLHEKLWQHEECSSRFWEAQQLSEYLFDLSIPGRKLPPFFNDHGLVHFQSVSNLLSQMIFGPDPQEPGYSPDYAKTLLSGLRAFVHTPEEAMYLLSAAWLHDIGMVYGIFDNERVEGPGIDWESLRYGHEQRSSKYIQEHWWSNCHWSKDEKVYLSLLCHYHRRHHPLEEIQLVEIDGRFGQKVRLRELAALLRLADACHIQDSRTPVDLRNFFEALGLPAAARVHWGLPLLVHSVAFDHSSAKIVVNCIVPTRRQFGTAWIDFQPAVDRIVESVQRELNTVIPYLSQYSNLAFRLVEHNTKSIAFVARDDRLQKLWPCMLSMVSSGSAAARMLAATLRAVVNSSQQVSEAEIKPILTEAVNIHPFNVPIRRLKQTACEQLATTTDHRKFSKWLDEYGNDLCESCNAVANEMAASIGPRDCLVIYGYSNAVMATLRAVSHRFKGIVIVVRYHRLGEEAAVRDETAIILQELSELKMAHQVVELASIPQVLEALKRTNKMVKVLVGTRGILDDGRALSFAGHRQIALAAQAIEVPVILVREAHKEANEPEINQAIKEQLDGHLTRLGVNIVSESQPTLTKTPHGFATQVDALTDDLYQTADRLR
jgi:translation initiation factor 2B subunit (eIF-2B alpha/beta/delta family)